MKPVNTHAARQQLAADSSYAPPLRPGVCAGHCTKLVGQELPCQAFAEPKVERPAHNKPFS